MKQAQIWISAVLYIALGVILITIILAAGLPLIEKMKDRNTFMQTKTLMYSIDDNIKQVAKEGPGSKRYLTIDIDQGELYINLNNNNKITWIKETKSKLMEPNIQFQEGSLNILLEPTETEEEYKLNLELDYNNLFSISLDSQYNNPLKGKYGLSIQHSGTYDTKGNPNIVLNIN